MGICIHCGGADETDDHVPSKVLLDEPYPTNLKVCPSCLRCNSALSLDEEYFACLLECAIAGEVDPTHIQRAKIARILNENPALMRRLQSTRSERDGQPHWTIESERVKAVVLKLARCHVAFEQNEPQTTEPLYIDFRPFAVMDSAERSAFENGDGDIGVWPEVGSRAMQRLFVLDSVVYSEDWLVVQAGNYRYRVDFDNGRRVRIVIREYLACEVSWD